MLLGVMVLFCAPLSRRVMQLSPLSLTLAMFSIPYQCWNGSGLEKGVCGGRLMPWRPPPGGPWAQTVLPEGFGLPSSIMSPLHSLTAHLLSWFLPKDNYG